MIALVPLLLSLPVLLLAKRFQKRTLRKLSFLGFSLWALLPFLAIWSGEDFLIYAASWSIWSALFLYLASIVWGGDDGWDPWNVFPDGPYAPKRKRSRHI